MRVCPPKSPLGLQLPPIFQLPKRTKAGHSGSFIWEEHWYRPITIHSGRQPHAELGRYSGKTPSRARVSAKPHPKPLPLSEAACELV